MRIARNTWYSDRNVTQQSLQRKEGKGPYLAVQQYLLITTCVLRCTFLFSFCHTRLLLVHSTLLLYQQLSHTPQSFHVCLLQDSFLLIFYFPQTFSSSHGFKNSYAPIAAPYTSPVQFITVHRFFVFETGTRPVAQAEVKRNDQSSLKPQAILPPQPPEQPGLQAHNTTPS